MPPRRGASTRERILDATQGLVLERGFAATSIDDILKKADLTKGAFFYHFESKAALAKALIDRYAKQDIELLEGSMARAEKLSRDPREQLLIFVGLIIEAVERVDVNNPLGCLFTSYYYESGEFDETTLAVISSSMLQWRCVVADKLRAIIKQQPPCTPVDPDSLADMLMVVTEGAYMVVRVYRSPKLFADQLRHYRSYLELLFP